MKTHSLLPVVCCLLFAPPAFADRFHFGTAEEAAKSTEGSPDSIEGVLVKEEDDNYVIRVEGGEVTVAKSLVYKIDKDGLTVADLELREKDAAARLVEADAQRRELLAAEAADQQVRRDEVQAREAAMATEPAPATVVEVAPPVFDPIIGRAYGAGAGAFLEGYYVQSVFGGILRRQLDRQLRADIRERELVTR